MNELARRVAARGQAQGLSVQNQPIANPRKEKETHHYNPAHSGLLELGLKPHFLTDDVLDSMLTRVREHADLIDREKILPRVAWPT